MLTLIAIRILSFGGMSLLSLRVPFALSQSIFFATLFGHYVVQLVYSPRQLQEGLRPVAPWRLFALLGTFALANYTRHLPMGLFFGVHFVFSELYTGELRAEGLLPFFSRALTVSATYLLCCAGLPEFASLPRAALLAALLFGFAGLALSGRRHLGLLAYEAVGVPFALLLPQLGRSQLTDIIFVHLVFWFLYPLRRLRGQALVRYLAITAGLTGAFFAFTPASGLFDIGFPAWALLATLTGNVHITLSFALSASNPGWVRALFQPRAPAPLSFPVATP